MILITDYGTGNVKSIANMLKKIGHASIVSNKAEDIRKSEKIILPGVGSFDQAMKMLHQYNLIEILTDRVLNHLTPVLGICLGMQLFAKTSEEGISRGLGWINGDVKKFSFDPTAKNKKIPHMGWARIRVNKPHPLFKDVAEKNRFYFVHSYHFVPRDPSINIATTQYGYAFTSAIAENNIVGVQFHPEKSHKFGMQILKNFAEI